MFGNSLENCGKSNRECKQTNKHSDKFPKFLKKFSEVFGKNRRMSRSAQNDLPAFLKFLKFLKVFRIIWKKMSESSQDDLPAIFVNFQKFPEIFGNAWKTSENLGKFSNVIGGLRNF